MAEIDESKRPSVRQGKILHQKCRTSRRSESREIDVTRFNDDRLTSDLCIRPISWMGNK